MSAGHLYHYFPSKEAIVEAMVSAKLEETERRFARTAQDGGDVLDVIAGELAHGDDDVHRRAPLLFDLLAHAGRSRTIAEMLARHSRGMQAMLADLLRRGQARGEVDSSLDVEVVAPVLVSLVDGSKSLALRSPHLSPSLSDGMLRLLVSRFLSPSACGSACDSNPDRL